MSARPDHLAAVAALRELYRPPDTPERQRPHEAGESNNMRLGGRAQHTTADPTAMLLALLPMVASEARTVLDAARELWLLGGIHPDEGRRLRLAVERIGRAVELIAEAEREVQR